MLDPLGDRMKKYEEACERRLLPLLPTFARVDGRCFHSLTRGLARPYDERLTNAMRETALFLAQETNARMTHTQSDEITLVWLATDPKSQIWFAGRHSKMVSQIAALATLQFYRSCKHLLPELQKHTPSFDARVWQVPNLAEGANVFVWRELDATRNSINMAAQSFYSHAELKGKGNAVKQEMLHVKGVNWNDYPDFFKKGTYFQRFTQVRKFTATELETLPPRHAARQDPELTVARNEIRELEMPPLLRVANREDVVFHGANPVTLSPVPPPPVSST